MYTFLDLLVIVFMGLSALSLVAACLMFLLRNQTARRVMFYIVVALGIYTATVGVRIGSLLTGGQMILALVLGAGSIAALVMERIAKGRGKLFTAARIVAAVSLVAGIINAFG